MPANDGRGDGRHDVRGDSRPDGGRENYLDPEALTLGARLRTAVETFRERRWSAWERAWTDSRVNGLVDRVAVAGRRSRLVRWLTAEPDPQVVVIDLRETVTVGPVLALLERLLAPLASAAPRSRLLALGDRLARVGRENPVPLASAALLGLVLVTLARTWTGADGLWLAALALAGLAALVGLLVDRSTVALENSRLRDLVAAAIAPPDDLER